VRIIDRYIGRELLTTMALGLGLFTTVLLTEKILELMDLIITKHVPVGIVARLFLYTLPSLLLLTVPMAVLLAVTATYGRLAAEQELTALKAAGCSLYRLSRPAVIIGVLALLFALWNSLYAVPAGSRAFRDLLFLLARTRATIGVKERVFNADFHGLILFTNRLHESTGSMEGVFIVDSQNEESPRIITARQGHVVADERNSAVRLELQDGSTHTTPGGRVGHYRILRFRTLKLALSVGNPQTTGNEEMGPEAMTIAELSAQVRERSRAGEGVADLLVSLHQRFATPAACLVFVLLGIPVAMRVRRSGRGVSLGLTMILAMAYYVVMISGQGLGKQEILHPFWATWLPNLVFGAVGLLLFIGGNSDSWVPRTMLSPRRPNPTVVTPEGRS
jgi:lipopolysaccharide export system permease protein